MTKWMTKWMNDWMNMFQMYYRSCLLLHIQTHTSYCFPWYKHIFAEITEKAKLKSKISAGIRKTTKAAAVVEVTEAEAGAGTVPRGERATWAIDNSCTQVGASR